MKTLGLIRIIGAAAATAAAVVTLAFAATVGQAARPPVIAWSPVTSPGTFDYGAVDVSQADSQTFALTNSGGSATGMLRVSLSGSATFSITADGCTGTALGPRKSCNVTVQYAPTTAGQTTATLAANATRPASSASITLKGTGHSTTGPGDLVLQDGEGLMDNGTDSNGTKNYFYDFGTGATQIFNVHNKSTTDTSDTLQLEFDGSTIAISGDTCSNHTLAPGDTCQFVVTVTPPAVCNQPCNCFDTPVAVFGLTNGFPNPYPYILLDAHGSCPTPP